MENWRDGKMKKQTVNTYTCPNCRNEMHNDKLGSLNDHMVVCESCGWRGWTKNVLVTTQIVDVPLKPGERLVTMCATTDKTAKGVKRGKNDEKDDE